MTARLHMDNEDLEWRKRAQVWILEGLLEAGFDPPERVLTGPVEVRIRSYFELAKSHHRATPVARAWRTSKPDGDNVEKAVLDALNELAFADDACVARMTWEKFTGAQDEAPRIEIEIVAITVDPNGKPLHAEKSLFAAPDSRLDDDAHTRALRDR